MNYGIEGVHWIKSGPGRIIPADSIPKEYWEDHDSAWFSGHISAVLSRLKGPSGDIPGGGIPRPGYEAESMGWGGHEYSNTWAWIPEEYFGPDENELGEIAP